MDQPVSAPLVYAFDQFRLDKQARQLVWLGDNGEAVSILLGARALDILAVLAEHSPLVVSKRQIMDAVWSGLAVEECNLTVQISALRRAVDREGRRSSLIRTVHSRGYLLTAAVTRASWPQQDVSFTRKCRTRREVAASVRPTKLPRASVAVAALRNLGVAKEHEYLVDDLIESVSAHLSQSKVSVIGPVEPAICGRQAPGPRHNARALGVGYLIVGSIRGAVDGIEVNLQLVDTEIGIYLWSQRFTLSAFDTKDARDETCGWLAQTILQKLNADLDRRIEILPAREWIPSDHIHHGYALLSRPLNGGQYHAAIRHFEHALVVEPRSIDAQLGIAAALIVDVEDGLNSSVEQNEERAERLVLDVLRADANVPLAHMLMGILRRVQGCLEDSRIALEIAIELRPCWPSAICNLGQTLTCLGDPEHGIALIKQCIRLAPHENLAPLCHCCLGIYWLLLGHIEEALTSLRTALALNPRLYYVHWGLAAALGLRNELGEANAALRQAMGMRPQLASPSRCYVVSRRPSPAFIALFEKTIYPGLRRAGLPDIGPATGQRPGH
jgi:DNA-binding winged helix-turn-helix (wHTH) protein/tetratricopeptide (TPR) repeat protein